LIIAFIFPTRNQLLNYNEILSIRILDRDGKLMREVLSQHDATSRYCALTDISPWLIKATLVSEDKRFFFHKGIDLLAIIRAIIQNIKHQDIISGGSTITQQLARNLLNLPSRNVINKLLEAFLAVNLEFKLNKEEILELYFNYAPYGNQTYGIEAASYLYFRKPARDLSLREATYLVSIPKAPSHFDPYRYPERILNECTKTLNMMYKSKIIDSTICTNALQEPIHLTPKEQNFLAPHFCEYVLALTRHMDVKNISSVKTTLDLYMQQATEKIIKNNIKKLTDANVTNAAAIIFDNRTMEVLAYVGSVDFFDPLISGEVDGVRSLRQPGSALKPFTYAIALENGATAATLIPDLPIHETTFGGDYTPRNYDEKYHGIVRLRTALACSYNIPAVRVCGEYGPEMLLDKLKKLGFQNLDKSPIYYGLGLTLGNGEVSLLELTRAFTVIGHYGLWHAEQPLMSIDGVKYFPRTKPRRIFSPEVSFIVMDILSDNNARSPAFGRYSPLNLPFFCAAKTGTSKNFRDNWCVGFTDKYLVGVWVGNFDGSSMHHVSGITGAGPVFRDIMLMLHREKASKKYAHPENIVYREICTLSGELANEHCRNTMYEIFCTGTEPRTVCSMHTGREHMHDSPEYKEHVKKNVMHKSDFAISYPDDGDIFKMDPILRMEYQQLKFQIESTKNIKEVTWFINDKIIGTTTFPFSIGWQLSPGEHRIVACALTNDNIHIKASPVSILVLE